jgi:outer membrane protein TolC
MTPLVRATALALLFATPAAAQTTSIDLSEALQRALDVQPTMVEAQGDVRIASADERAAWGAFLPSISTSAGASGTFQQESFPTNYSLGWNANLPLFEGFARLQPARASRPRMQMRPRRIAASWRSLTTKQTSPPPRATNSCASPPRKWRARRNNSK